MLLIRSGRNILLLRNNSKDTRLFMRKFILNPNVLLFAIGLVLV